jgi:hypothetical protein
MGKTQMFGGRPVLQFALESDRRNFLRYAGLVGVGASFVAGGVLDAGTAVAAQPFATPSSAGDLGILNYALTLEYLEADFYTKGVASGKLTGRTLALLSPIRDHEDAHVSAISAAIKAAGGTTVTKPKIKYPDGTFGSADTFLATAHVFEELGVTAYHGQVPLIKSVAVLGAAASIAGVESRHAAIIASLIGENPFPAPIEKHHTKAYVIKAVTPFLA